MMQIHDLGEFSPPTSRYFLLLETSACFPGVPGQPNLLQIISSVEEIIKSKDHELAIVVSSVETAIEAAFKKLELDSSDCILLIPRSERAILEKLLGAARQLSIAGINMTSDWLQIKIERPVGGDRPASDLLLGVTMPPIVNPPESVLRPDRMLDSISAPIESQNVRWRDTVISRILPAAKRFKPLLPTRTVVFLYKLLEKIR